MSSRKLLVAILVLLALPALLIWQAQPVLRAEGAVATPTPTATPGPNRTTTINVAFTSYQWWLNRWSDNQVLCVLWVEHDGVPFAGEISYYCDASVYNFWLQTKPCPQAETGGDVTQCSGGYLHLIGSQDGERQITVDLPAPTAWISLSGCTPSPPGNRCASLPSLQLSGVEPLPNETIINIQGTIGGAPFSCPGASCDVPLPPTGVQGIRMEFWANSSFGDSTVHYTALVRAVPWGDFMAPEGNASDQQLWYVDVISTQWQGSPLASCSEVWDAFPALSGLPQWLTTPDRVEDLTSNQPLYYLAGVLIENGQVDASGCPDNGLTRPGVANACGLEEARPAIQAWQNQFDPEIIQVAKDTGVPAQLMKNVFARESQFWPGVYQTYQEAGLGQLTENGADTALLWNPSFFNQFCPLVFRKDVCDQGWWQLTPEHQAMLKGAVVGKVNAACPNCPSGIDLSRARFSVSVFAQTLRANCEQTGQIVYNVTGKAAGASSSYQDLWLFTLVNYNAGPGCLSSAVKAANQAREPLDWPHVGNRLQTSCPDTIDYVRSITNIEAPGPALTATAAAPTAATPIVVYTPTPAPFTPTPRTATGTPTTATPTAGAYPAPGATPTSESYPPVATSYP